MQAVMYHYVRPETDAPPAGYYHLPLERFRAQLDHLEAKRTLLSKRTFRACLRGDRDPPEDGVVLTFDDGLLDHYRWVKPELERRDLWGVFFVSTAPLVDGRRLAVNRVHTLVSEYPGEQLLDALTDVLADHDELTVPAAESGMYEGRDTAESVREFKRLCNEEIPYEYLPAVLDELEARFPAADVPASDLYLSAEQVRALSASGMVIGAHSVSHPILSRLSPDRQRAEITESHQQLADIAGQEIDLFAYPYGGAETYTDRTRALVADAGFEGAFTTQSGDVTAEMVAADPLTLPRRDCTEIRHGDTASSLPE